ncbi:hypothetical protein HYH03_002314 [Edaphochlamys debaryana]|uniref:AP2/ERF domain-containing protein n=1 Tax=Edaphochlamys debaryana TaxID=47281 RepID=A0A835YF19_9CHLO|nr:hypothetical protein HYH03_002314 [Edaphochlamys debaryana]|eukprot:KAG2500033.1 hypothetical protein HYH03_002314 [Edaphochlamys debaryana]
MHVGAKPCPGARQELQHRPAADAGPLPDTAAAQPSEDGHSPPSVAAADSLRGFAGPGAAPHASAAVPIPAKAPAAAAAGGGRPGLAQPGPLGAAAQQGGGSGRAAVNDAVSQLRAGRSRAVDAQQRERRLREAAEQRQRQAEERQIQAEERQRQAEQQQRQAEAQAREAAARAQEAEDQRWEAVEGGLEAEGGQQEAEAAAASLRDQLQAAEVRAAEAQVQAAETAQQASVAAQEATALREEVAGLRIALAAAQLGAQAAASGLRAQLQAAREEAAGAAQRAQEAQAQETASLQGQLAACQEQLAAAQSQADPLRLEVAALRDVCSRECSLKREHQKRAGQLQNQATAAQFRVGELMQQVTALEARRREAERAAAQAQREAAREGAAAAEARSALQQSEARAAEVASAHARELQGAAERQQQLQSEACRLSGALRQRELELGRATDSSTALQTQLERERRRADVAVSGANADVERLCAERAQLCSLLRQAGVQLPAWASAGPSAAALPSPGPQGLGGGPGTAAPPPLGPATPAAAGPSQPSAPQPGRVAQAGASGLPPPRGLPSEVTAAEGPSGIATTAALPPAEGPGLLAQPGESTRRQPQHVPATEAGQGLPAEAAVTAAVMQEEGLGTEVAPAQASPAAEADEAGVAERAGTVVEGAAAVVDADQAGQREATAPLAQGYAAAGASPGAMTGTGRRTGWGLAARAAAPHAPQRGPAPLSAAAEHTQPLLLPALAAWGTQLEQQRQHTILLPAAQPCPTAAAGTDARAPAAGASSASPASSPQEAPAAQVQPSPRPQTCAQAATQAAEASGEAQTEPAGKAKEATGLSGRSAAGGNGAEAFPAATLRAAGSGRGSEEGSGPQPMEGLEGGSGAQAQASLGPPAAGGASGAQAPGAQCPSGEVHQGNGRARAALGPSGTVEALETQVPGSLAEVSEEELSRNALPEATDQGARAQSFGASQGGGSQAGAGSPAPEDEERAPPCRPLRVGPSQLPTPQPEGGPSSRGAHREQPSGAAGDKDQAAVGAASPADGQGGSGPQPVKAEGGIGGVGRDQDPRPMAAGADSTRGGQGTTPLPAAPAGGGGPQLQLMTAPGGPSALGGAEGTALGAGSGARVCARTGVLPDRGPPEAGEGEGEEPSTARTAQTQGADAGCAGPGEGSAGQSPRYGSTAGILYRGVVRGTASGSFSARIRQGKQLLELGTFSSEQEAARAYDIAAAELFNSGQSRTLQLNFPSEWIHPARGQPVLPRTPQPAAGDSGVEPSPAAAPAAAGSGRVSEEGSGPQPTEGLEGVSGAQAPGAQGPVRVTEENGVQALAAGIQPLGVHICTAELPLGVYVQSGGRFKAQLRLQGKSNCLGTYSTPEEAARAYDRAAVHRHNEGLSSWKLRLNFPAEWSDPNVRPVVPRAGPGVDRGCMEHAANDRDSDGGAGDEEGAGGDPGTTHAGFGLSGLPRGVMRQCKGGRYEARIRRDGKKRSLGTWNTPEEAGRAFDRAAVERYNAGEGGKLELNYPSEWSDPAQGRPVVPRVQPAQGGGPGEAGAQPGAAPGAAGSGLDGRPQAQPGPDPASGPRPAPRKRSAAQGSGGPSQAPQPGDGPGGKRGRTGPGAAEGDTP